MPHMKGSFTICEKAVATAASKALPPFARIAAPTSAARGCGQTTTPFMIVLPRRLVIGGGVAVAVEADHRVALVLWVIAFLERIAGGLAASRLCGDAVTRDAPAACV